jgi:hypothetical protein
MSYGSIESYTIEFLIYESEPLPQSAKMWRGLLFPMPEAGKDDLGAGPA